MATTVHKYGLLSSLIDLVDEQWAQETLPDDGEAVPAVQACKAFAGSRLVPLWCRIAAAPEAATLLPDGCIALACIAMA